VIGLLTRVAAALGNPRAVENARRGLGAEEWAHARIEAVARRYPAPRHGGAGDGNGDPVRAA
jgi:hypothetical protein